MLRRPLFIAAVVVFAIAVLAEIGLALLLGGSAVDPVPPSTATSMGVEPEVLLKTEKADADPPGAGIGYLAFLDGLLLFTVVMLGLSLIMNLRAYGRIQGIVTLIVTFLWVVAAFFTALLALAKLFLMLGLLVATPFGTIAYLALWGSFPVTEAAVILGLILLLKIVFVVLLVLSQPAFLKITGLVLLIVVSVVLQLVLGLIHGFLPGPLVSIGDQFWALITVVVALVWALVMLIGSIPAIVNAVRVSGSLAD
ncbi:hypothetical protein V1638_05640 [Pseudarthrobacter sp. J64]|uniref:hypothetical protein n=1 Tax=Pseudarthrobacter sp. J64 TaxID=3116485 RepID=UPI002E810B75|nr:hypothetical protein [Pseudarthrobacter sp. J64]MEE2568878.1 hypothetical protein [Pseudarthrobacter sp. J64]